MAKVVGVGFKEIGKIYWFKPESYDLKVNDYVVVETVRGIELARVIEPIKEVDDNEIEHDLKPVIRIATEKDIERYQENKIKAQNAIEKIKEIIEKHELEMKTIDCEYTLDSSKLLIYYTADGRVDFRELVKDLASKFRVRIELRQIGQRESAKMIGGIGPCGRPICCKSHLREFDLVTMKAAKEQGMALSAGKIAGLCGKLMCCINYESDYYTEIKEKLPAVGEYVTTPSCPCCKVISVDYLRQLVRTETEGNEYEEWPATKVQKIDKEELEKNTDGTNS
jgi:cell fate regulator YaaT (PSP1 superfamily)